MSQWPPIALLSHLLMDPFECSAVRGAALRIMLSVSLSNPVKIENSISSRDQRRGREVDEGGSGEREGEVEGEGVGGDDRLALYPSTALMGQLLSSISALLTTDNAASSLSSLQSGLSCLLSVYQYTVISSRMSDDNISLCGDFLDLVRNLKILPKIVGALCPNLLKTLLFAANRRMATISTSTSTSTSTSFTTSDMLLTHSNHITGQSEGLLDGVKGSERDEEILSNIREAASRFLQQLESTDSSLFVQCVHHSPLLTYLVSTISSSSSSSSSPSERAHSNLSTITTHQTIFNYSPFRPHQDQDDDKDKRMRVARQFDDGRLRAFAAQTDLLCVILRAEKRMTDRSARTLSHPLIPLTSPSSLTYSALKLNPLAPLDVLNALSRQLQGLTRLLSLPLSVVENLKVS